MDQAYVKTSSWRTEMSTSYWGVEHGDEISKDFTKNKTPASAGRLATGAAFGGWHGAVAGKKGSKLKAFATPVVTANAGSLAGNAAAIATKGRGATALRVGGALAGGASGTVISQKRGWLKKQPGR